MSGLSAAQHAALNDVLHGYDTGEWIESTWSSPTVLDFADWCREVYAGAGVTDFPPDERRLIVAHLVDQGWTVADAAAATMVSRKTAQRDLRRRHQAWMGEIADAVHERHSEWEAADRLDGDIGAALVGAFAMTEAFSPNEAAERIAAVTLDTRVELERLLRGVESWTQSTRTWVSTAPRLRSVR